MMMSPMLFICLFLAGFGVFLMGAGVIWWVSLQERMLKLKENATHPG